MNRVVSKMAVRPAAGPPLRVIPGISPPTVPPPSPPARSYEVRVRRSVGEAAFLIGHDGRGETMMEVRVAPKHVTADLVRRIEMWCREHDAGPELEAIG